MEGRVSHLEQAPGSPFICLKTAFLIPCIARSHPFEVGTNRESLGVDTLAKLTNIISIAIANWPGYHDTTFFLPSLLHSGGEHRLPFCSWLFQPLKNYGKCCKQESKW